MELWRPYLDQAENINRETLPGHQESELSSLRWSPSRKSAFSRYQPCFESQSPMLSPESQKTASTSGAASPGQSLDFLAAYRADLKEEPLETELEYQTVTEDLFWLHQPYQPYEHPSPEPLSTPPTSSPERPDSTSQKGPKRPFKAVAECVAAADPSPSYAAFRAAMLEAMCARNGGSLTVTNPRMRRSVYRDDDVTDPEYQHRRARNNAAAKRSRDLRKRREDELAIRMAFLERENEQLRESIAGARANPVCGSCWTHL